MEPGRVCNECQHFGHCPYCGGAVCDFEGAHEFLDGEEDTRAAECANFAEIDADSPEAED